MTSLSQNLFCPRFFAAAGGLFGAAGIASYAAAHHAGGFYHDFAPILLGNAPVFIALALTKTQALLPRLAGVLIFFGGLLFTAALFWQQVYGHHLFPMAAPIGGMLMIIGWLLFIPAAFCLSSCGNAEKQTKPTLH